MGAETAGEKKTEGIESYSTKSDIMLVFAERTTRSLKNILYRYVEDFGDRYFHNLSQFVTTQNSTKKCSIYFITKNIKDSDFLFTLYSKPLRENRNRKSKAGDKFRISKCALPFRKVFEPQFTRKVFELVAISIQKTSNIHKRI